MRDDVEFNVQFIELIEGNSSLYDYNRRDYGNRNVQDKVWQTIATKLKESVADCKERWKNIRGRYLKYIKKVPPSGSAAKTVKMYYLADNLHFLDKFLKSRPARGNMTQSQNIEEIQVDENFNAPGNNRSAENSDVENEVDPSPPNLTPPTMPRNPLSTIQLTTSSGEETAPTAIKKVPQIAEGNKRKKMTPTLNDVNASAINYFEERKKNLQKNKVDVGGDPDMAFFHSILPDMKSMDGGQKRQFKIGILNLAGQILQGSSNNVTLCSPTINYQSPNPNESRPESRENSVPRMVNSMMESVNDGTTYPLFTPFSPVSTVSSHGATRHMDHMQLASALNEPIDMTENVESTFITYL